jgi:hypothetical protein
MILLLFFFTVVKADFNIIGNHSFCHETDLVLEFDQVGQLSTALNILRLHEDEFNLIHMNGNSLVVYANYGQLYSTKCVSIHEIFIPSIVDTCTFDLPVYYVSNDNIKITLFLTKIGILRNGSTIIRCSQEPSVFNIGNKIITVHNKTVKINDKKGLNFLKLLNYNNKISNYSQNESYTFFDYYFQNFAKNKVFITIRDIIEYFFMAAVVYLFKNKFSGLILYILKKIYKLKAIKINGENVNTNRKFISTIRDSTIVKYIEGNAIGLPLQVSQPLSEEPNNLISCKTCKDCKTRHCPCKREGLHCNSFCHNGVPCQNQGCF